MHSGASVPVPVVVYRCVLASITSARRVAGTQPSKPKFCNTLTSNSNANSALLQVPSALRTVAPQIERHVVALAMEELASIALDWTGTPLQTISAPAVFKSTHNSESPNVLVADSRYLEASISDLIPNVSAVAIIELWRPPTTAPNWVIPLR